jgi:hypothetical protein
MARVGGRGTLGLAEDHRQDRLCPIQSLKPHRHRTFTLSTDDFFVEKVRDVVGLYMNPPDHAVVLCLDEKPTSRSRSGLISSWITHPSTTRPPSVAG